MGQNSEMKVDQIFLDVIDLVDKNTKRLYGEDYKSKLVLDVDYIFTENICRELVNLNKNTNNKDKLFNLVKVVESIIAALLISDNDTITKLKQYYYFKSYNNSSDIDDKVINTNIMDIRSMVLGNRTLIHKYDAYYYLLRKVLELVNYIFKIDDKDFYVIFLALDARRLAFNNRVTTITRKEIEETIYNLIKNNEKDLLLAVDNILYKDKK